MEIQIDDQLLKLYGHVTDIANQIIPIVQKLSDLEAKTISQEAYIELLMGFISSRDSKNEFLDHLKYVSTSHSYTETVRAAAAEVLRQKTLWPDELMKQEKQ